MRQVPQRNGAFCMPRALSAVLGEHFYVHTYGNVPEWRQRLYFFLKIVDFLYFTMIYLQKILQEKPSILGG